MSDRGGFPQKSKHGKKWWCWRVGVKVAEKLGVRTLAAPWVYRLKRTVTRGQSEVGPNQGTAVGGHADLFSRDLVFRYASCDDLVVLKAKYPEFCFAERGSDKSFTWGLKQMGTLFCYERIALERPARVLEVGAGCNTFFDEHIGNRCEYWMIHDANFVGAERFNAAAATRGHTNFVNGLLGHSSEKLPDDYFDVVFSISALEHVPRADKESVYGEIFRVLRKGGLSLHSIDLPSNHAARQEFDIMARKGFAMSPCADLLVRTMPGEGPATLFEPMDVVFRSYFGKGRSDMWTNLRKIDAHHPTVLVAARKPSGPIVDANQTLKRLTQ